MRRDALLMLEQEMDQMGLEKRMGVESVLMKESSMVYQYFGYLLDIV